MDDKIAKILNSTRFVHRETDDDQLFASQIANDESFVAFYEGSGADPRVLKTLIDNGRFPFEAIKTIASDAQASTDAPRAGTAPKPLETVALERQGHYIGHAAYQQQSNNIIVKNSAMLHHALMRAHIREYDHYQDRLKEINRAISEMEFELKKLQNEKIMIELETRKYEINM